MVIEDRFTYFVQVRDWNGSWVRLGVEHETASEAQGQAREWLRAYGYRDVALRVVKVHTHRTFEVIDETGGAA